MSGCGCSGARSNPSKKKKPCCAACAKGSARGTRENPRKPSAASQVPKGEIDWIVGNMHVGTPDEEVADDIARRCAKVGVPKAVATACIRHALKTHQRNRDLYSDVMMGRTSRRRIRGR